MRCTSRLCSILAVAIPAAGAETVSSEPQLTQALIAEIRNLRIDVQNTATTIQRVQIMMYRLQAQAAILDRAEQRMNEARTNCRNAEQQQKSASLQIEGTESRMRDIKDPSQRNAMEERLLDLKFSAETSKQEAQECQAEQINAENGFRGEQSKMSELQGQLDRLEQELTMRVAK